MKKWYAVYTVASFERKVANQFRKRGFEYYLPLMPTARSGNAKFRILFSKQIFVKTTEQGHQSLKQIPGVLNLFHWHGAPAVIHDKEIIMLKNFLDTYANVTVLKTGIDYKSSPQIFEDFSIEEKSLIQTKQIKLLLPSLGYILMAPEKEIRQGSFSKKSVFQNESVLDLNLNL